MQFAAKQFLFGIIRKPQVSLIPFFSSHCVRPSALRTIRGTITALVLTATAGCTTIYISTHDGGPPRVERSLGLVSIRMPDDAETAAVVVSRGFGAARTPTGFTLGFWKEQAAIFGDPSICRTVVWVEERQALDAIRGSLSDAGGTLDSLCIIDGDTP
jgi:hypothetical protein